MSTSLLITGVSAVLVMVLCCYEGVPRLDCKNYRKGLGGRSLSWIVPSMHSVWREGVELL